MENDGYISNAKIYLTEEEYENLMVYVKQFVEDHSEEKEDTIKYSSLFGIILKD